MLLGIAIRTRSGDVMKCDAYAPLLQHVVGVRKLDFSHHDSPAAMFAVYDASAGRGEHAEAAAKGAEALPHRCSAA